MPETTPFPKVLKALGDGCNMVANRVYLMCLPFALDIFLLFGPKLRIREYLQPMFNAFFNQIQNGLSNTGIRQLEASFDLLESLLGSMNLFGFIQTYPIGVSVLASASGSETPLGKSIEIEMTSILQILPIIFAMMALGIVLGTVYYAINAKAVNNAEGKLSLQVFGTQFLNTILLYIALIVVIVILAIPISCMMTFALMIAPVIYQILSLLVIVLVCWLIIPVFYIPHGIFIKNLDFPHAVKESFEMASWSGAITVRFILLSMVISLGLDMVWTIPDQSSWLILISIFGHAFVSTALLCSSFILFKELDHWKQENQAFLQWRKANLRIRKIIKKEPENHD